MSARLKLTIAYDGSAFAGWQSQKHGNTIQDRLEAAIERLIGKRLPVHGAGRTDAGVHAIGQCAHVDLPNRARSPNEWQRMLNALLPPQIRIMRARFVANDFHARFSARRKTYRYRLWTGAVLPPFELGRVWHVMKSIDFAKVQRATELFVGTHDFASFAANRGKKEASTRRTIHHAIVRISGSVLTIDFVGDGFLYKMVRMMIGAIVEHATGKSPLENIRQRLASPRQATATRVVAPAEGLILLKIHY
jgi:tRNA pseudouridine38-40 synthase